MIKILNSETNYDLQGEKIVPFCTSGGNEISRNMKGVKAAAKMVKGNDLTDVFYKECGKMGKKKVK